jgi:glucan phosphoethanolaminetransferase (alkaline phosphatase superfamily)
MTRRHAPASAALWWGAFSLAIVGAYLLLDDFALFRMGAFQASRGDVGRPLLNAAAYVGPYLLGLLALVLLQGHARPGVRYTAHAIAVAAIATQLGFATINGQGFTITDATLFWAEFEFIPSALRFFLGNYLVPLLGAIAGVVLLEATLRPRLSRISTLWVLALPVVASLAYFQLLKSTDAKVEQFPVPFRVPVLIAYAHSHQTVYLGQRDEVAFAPVREPLADHIVFVVDESIRGDVLTVNGGPPEATPFLAEIEPRLLNYGVASAVANLSGPANIVLQSGLRPDQLPDVDMRSMKNPNVFAYMREAGFYTVYINAQNLSPRPPNFMTEADVAGIDAYIQVRNIAPGLREHEVDHRIPALVERIVSGHDRTFTYVLKNGAHFPYAGKFPEEQHWFTPERWAEGYSTWEARILAEYMNTVRWTVDEFLRKLVASLDGAAPRVLIVYTADHGQDLFEADERSGRRRRGHGHVDPSSYQAMIPLLLIPLDAALREELRALYHPSLRDQISAFEIFPSLLRLAGYGHDDVRQRYAPSIFDLDADRGRRVFVSGNHFGAGGPLYRDAPYQSSFRINEYSPGGG